MEQDILLSILIPVYNATSFLDKCLCSIVGQKEFNNYVELVIINDGSKDNSLEIINSYASKFDNIHVISRENRGIGTTRNELIDNTKGKYFWFVDADDYISDKSLSIIIPLLQTNTYDMLLLSYYWGDTENGKNIIYSGEYENGLIMAENEVFNNSLWTRIYRASIIKENQIRFQNFKMGEDFDFILHTIPKLGKMKCIEEPLYNYINNPNSAVSSKDEKHRLKTSEDSIECLKRNFIWIKQFNKREQLTLRKPLNFFLLGYLFSIYVVPFSYSYKKNVMKKLLNIKALPIEPLPCNIKYRWRSLIINNYVLRNITLWIDVIALKLFKSKYA